jgi:Domain of unknown function (DUF222)
MTIDTTLAPHPVVAALERVEEAIAEARNVVWSLGDDDVVLALDLRERLAAQFDGLGLDLIAQADVRGVASQVGASSTAALLRDRLRIRPGDASARVRLAGDRQLEATRVALSAGDITLGHAKVIEHAVTRLPASVREDAQAFLLREAATFDPRQLQQLARHIRHVVDPDAVEREEQTAADRRELRLAGRGDGTDEVRIVWEHEATAKLLSALDPLAAPRPAEGGGRDLRSLARRRADALVELLDRMLGSGDLPASRGVRPHVTISAGLETLLRMPHAPAADTTWGGPVSAETLRRIACDALVRFVLFDQQGVPLDVGREQRTVPPGMWAALVVRDRGCIWPGCTRPAEWCSAHHVHPWSDGGVTALGNLTLVCGPHHRAVHHTGWEIRFGDDGHPELLPPAWVDPQRRPRRNTYWRIRDRLPPPHGT